MKRVPVSEIERIIDDLETRCQTATNIAVDSLVFGKKQLALMQIIRAGGYKYAAGELKKLL